MADGDNQENLKLTLKKSRASVTGEDIKPAAEEGEDLKQTIKKMPKMGDSTVELKDTMKSIPKMVDPTQMRNKPAIKSLKPRAGIKADPTAGAVKTPGSDTVVLKVIKEKKKKLAGIMSASQTIRLRPPSGEGDQSGAAAPAAAAAPPAKPPAARPPAAAPPAKPSAPATISATPGQGTLASKQTLKIKAPGREESGTGTMQRPTLKIKQGTPAARPGGGAPTLKIKAGPPQAASAAPPAAGTKATLKIKVPSAAPAAAPQASAPAHAAPSSLKSTLKIKAPSVSTAGPSSGGPGGSKPAKTLKLKAVPRPAAPSAGPAAAAAPASAAKPVVAQQKVVLPKKGADPDILYTLSAAASFVVGGVMIGLMIKQYTDLFQ